MSTKGSFRVVASEVNFKHEKFDRIYETFFAVSDFLKEHPNPGACHLLSGFMYVLMKEQDIDCTLRLGEVKRPDGKFFDHSWIEIDQKVFDVAIQLTYDEQKNPPVFAGIDLGSGEPTSLIYGASSGKGLDIIAKRLLETPFDKYIEGFRFSNKNGWDFIQQIARKKLRLKLDIQTLGKKYADTVRVV